MKEHVVEDLLAFEADHVWVNKNLNALLEKYAEQWIAVRNGQVIASNPDLTSLLSKLLVDCLISSLTNSSPS